MIPGPALNPFPTAVQNSFLPQDSSLTTKSCTPNPQQESQGTFVEPLPGGGTKESQKLPSSAHSWLLPTLCGYSLLQQCWASWSPVIPAGRVSDISPVPGRVVPVPLLSTCLHPHRAGTVFSNQSRIPCFFHLVTIYTLSFSVVFAGWPRLGFCITKGWR